jgi:hypothetical protein
MEIRFLGLCIFNFITTYTSILSINLRQYKPFVDYKFDNYSNKFIVFIL